MNLQQRVESEIKNITTEMDVVEILNKKLQSNLSLDSIEVRAAALSLVSVYNGIEKILERIIKDKYTFNANSNWHSELLKISKEMNIINDSTYEHLKSYLAFRHFVRHAYSFQINTKTIETVLKMVPSLVNEFLRELTY